MKKTIALLAFMGSCAPAYAQQFGSIPILMCDKTESIERQLTEKYNEVVQFTGIRTPVIKEELWLNKETGTYTFVRTNVEEGISCATSAGKYGVMSLPKPKKPNL